MSTGAEVAGPQGLVTPSRCSQQCSTVRSSGPICLDETRHGNMHSSAAIRGVTARHSLDGQCNLRDLGTFMRLRA